MIHPENPTRRPIPSILLCRFLMFLTMLTIPSLGGCNGTETSSVAAPIRLSKDVEQVHAWLCGRFETEMPPSRISDALRAEWNACSIWPDREDGRWLYAERTTVGAASRSDDRHIHRIRNDAQGTLLVEVFSFLPGAVPPAGTWRTPEFFDRIDPALLVPREGCAIHLASDPQGYAGATRGTGCDRNADGTTHRMSRMSITSDSITLADRFLDSTGKPVSNTEATPAVFRRITAAD
ncbi:MAG: hypothetical protein CMJ27_06550 [Phycisphaerae bacterium]|nr:hypothetical protein [Phycisphaerae bacterium]OUX01559.1 MAG: hypothetical protein CBD91_04355 [Phycisphaeraceae bacterium TMED231]